MQTGNHLLLLIPRGRKVAVIVPCFYIRLFSLALKIESCIFSRLSIQPVVFSFKLPTLTIGMKALSLQYIIVFPYQFDLFFVSEYRVLNIMSSSTCHRFSLEIKTCFQNARGEGDGRKNS